MAKKKIGKLRKKETVEAIDEKVLPQNILSIGERVEEDKNIYISQKAYKDIHKFTKNKTKNESGGMLIGYTVEEFGKTHIVIMGFIEAKHCEATPTTLTFTHETWDYVHKEMDKKFPGGKIVGWIHTHPDFGIFLSEYDKFIHENFFNEENQIAYVVDPIQNIEGFYFWINGKIERCKGFYIYDKTGVEIDIEKEQDSEESPKEDSASLFSARNIYMGILTALVIFLLFTTLSQGGEIAKLKEQQQILIQSANQNFAVMQSHIFDLEEELFAFTNPQEEELPEQPTEVEEPAVEVPAPEESAPEAPSDGGDAVVEETVEKAT